MSASSNLHSPHRRARPHLRLHPAEPALLDSLAHSSTAGLRRLVPRERTGTEGRNGPDYPVASFRYGHQGPEDVVRHRHSIL
jgi:hypothetical protein